MNHWCVKQILHLVPSKKNLYLQVGIFKKTKSNLRSLNTSSVPLIPPPRPSHLTDLSRKFVIKNAAICIRGWRQNSQKYLYITCPPNKVFHASLHLASFFKCDSDKYNSQIKFLAQSQKTRPWMGKTGGVTKPHSFKRNSRSFNVLHLHSNLWSRKQCIWYVRRPVGQKNLSFIESNTAVPEKSRLIGANRQPRYLYLS